MDEHHEILDGSWAVIYTDSDGWKLEDQHCFSCFPLPHSTLREAAIKEGIELAKKIENRYQEA